MTRKCVSWHSGVGDDSPSVRQQRQLDEEAVHSPLQAARALFYVLAGTALSSLCSYVTIALLRHATLGAATVVHATLVCGQFALCAPACCGVRRRAARRAGLMAYYLQLS